MIEILLVTSRDTGRWVLPKGNREEGLALHQVAALEAEEEAGVVGWIDTAPIGEYGYGKRRDNGAVDQLAVAVFPLRVVDMFDEWKEAAQRERQWFAQMDAAAAVDEAGLSALISAFAPPPLDDDS